MSSTLSAYGTSFGIALAASLVLTLLVRTAARRFGWVAKPRPDRWHRKPTALFGGVGIFGGFLVAYLIRRPAILAGDALLVACAGGMFVIGLVDDKIQLKPYTKLIGQILCATAVSAFGLELHWIPNPILDKALTLFWLVGITNALNLLDNIDGAAGGIAAIAAACLVWFGHVAGNTEAARLAAAFCGAVLGFLVFNVNPASIFMGDCGSLFIGFVLGGLTLVDSDVVGARKNVLAVLTIPVLLLLLPIADTTLVTITRRFHGRRISEGGRDHTSHRLVALGMSERRATFTLWAIAACSGALAVGVRSVSAALGIFLVALFGMGLLFLMVFLGRVKVYEAVDAASAATNGRALLPTLADFSYKRRVFEILNDLVLIILSYYAAFLLRFDFAPDAALLERFISSLPVIIVTQTSVFLAAGLYQGVWRYTGMTDLTRIVKAVAAAVVVSTVATLFIFRFDGFSRAVVVIDALLLLLGTGGSRISFRLLRDWLVVRRDVGDAKRVLIYGAGDAGELLLRELKNNRALGMVPIGFVDDDPQKAGRLIHGVPVMGSSEELPGLLVSTRAHIVLLSSDKVDPRRWALVQRACTDNEVGYRRLRIALE